MPQIMLPIFPNGTTHIAAHLAFSHEQEDIIYYNGLMPVAMHREDDLRSFRMITAQFCACGSVTQAQISRAFGVPLISVKRAVKLYRKRGVAGFFEPRNVRGPAVLLPAVLEQGQGMLNAGMEPSEVAEQLDIKADTLSKAIRAGRLFKPFKKS